MDSEYIKQLLERYWQCETSPQEEAELRSYFLRADVPAHLLRYKAWFVYREEQQKIHLDEDFDQKVLKQIRQPVVKASPLSIWTHFTPLLKAVAVVAVMLSLGTVMRHTLFADDNGVIMPDTIGRQITTPSVAFSTEDTEEHNSLSLDSLKRIEPPKKPITR